MQGNKTESRGIVYVAFGKDYAELAYQTLRLSRRSTCVPMTIITNIINDTTDKWKEIGVDHFFIDMPTIENRKVKTLICNYTPYDLTLYMDCDSVIKQPGIETVFDYLTDCDIVFQHHATWRPGKPYYQIYQRVFKEFGIMLPAQIMIGGFFCFRKTEKVKHFFDVWNDIWLKTGGGRDMPSLACAVQLSGIKYKTITRHVDKYFSFGIDESCIVVHRSHGDDLEKRFGIKKHRQFKPFDKRSNNDWKLVLLNN